MLIKDDAVVPIPRHDLIKRGTLKAIIEEAGLTREEFLTLRRRGKKEKPTEEELSELDKLAAHPEDSVPREEERRRVEKRPKDQAAPPMLATANIPPYTRHKPAEQPKIDAAAQPRGPRQNQNTQRRNAAHDVTLPPPRKHPNKHTKHTKKPS